MLNIIYELLRNDPRLSNVTIDGTEDDGEIILTYDGREFIITAKEL